MAAPAAGNNRTFLERAAPYLPTREQVGIGVLGVGSCAITVISMVRLAGNAAASPQRFLAGVVCGAVVRIFGWWAIPDMTVSLGAIPGFGLGFSGHYIRAMKAGEAWDPFAVGASVGFLGINLLWQMFLTAFFTTPFFNQLWDDVIDRVIADLPERPAPANQNPPANVPPLAAAVPRQQAPRLAVAANIPPPAARRSQDPTPTAANVLPPTATVPPSLAKPLSSPLLSAEVNELLASKDFGPASARNLCDLIVQGKLTAPMMPALIADSHMQVFGSETIYDLLLWANAQNDSASLTALHKNFGGSIVVNHMMQECEKVTAQFQQACVAEAKPGAANGTEEGTIRSYLSNPFLPSFWIYAQLRSALIVRNNEVLQAIQGSPQFDRIPPTKKLALDALKSSTPPTKK